MSRRIAIWALAATAVLIAAEAKADRECFENSCRMPEVVDPPPPPPSPQAADPAARPEPAPAPEPARAPEPAPPPAPMRVQAAEPPLPPMMIEPPPRRAMQPAERREVETPRPAPARAPAAAPAPMPAPAVADAPAYPRPRAVPLPLAPALTPAAAPAPSYARRVIEESAEPRPRLVQRGYPTTPGYVLGNSAVRSVPGAAYADGGGVVVAHRVVRTDPAWKLCQIDGRDGRAYLCGPYSYHPYGVPGYRPLGTYRRRAARRSIWWRPTPRSSRSTTTRVFRESGSHHAARLARCRARARRRSTR